MGNKSKKSYDLTIEGNKIDDFSIKKVRKSMILIPNQDFAGEDGTMAEAMMTTTSLGNVSHVDRVEDEDRNEGHRV